VDKITKILKRKNAKFWLDEAAAILVNSWKCSDKDLVITLQEHKKNRSAESNRLQRKWMFELERQGDMTAEEYRGYCKLHFGIAIAKESEDFAEKYDRLLKPRTYEEKMQFMMVPVDLPVTRLFSTSQMHRYLNKIYENYTGQGYNLTLPEDKYWQSALIRGNQND